MENFGKEAIFSGDGQEQICVDIARIILNCRHEVGMLDLAVLGGRNAKRFCKGRRRRIIWRTLRYMHDFELRVQELEECQHLFGLGRLEALLAVVREEDAFYLAQLRGLGHDDEGYLRAVGHIERIRTDEALAQGLLPVMPMMTKANLAAVVASFMASMKGVH